MSDGSPERWRSGVVYGLFVFLEFDFHLVRVEAIALIIRAYTHIRRLVLILVKASVFGFEIWSGH